MKKIPQDLPQFENETAVLIVTGSQEAEVFRAESGEIEKLEEFKIEKPDYSDKEGWFQKSGLGRVFGSGGTEKDVKKDVRQKFFSKFEKQIRNIQKDLDPDFTYVFTPDYMHKAVEKIVNKSKLKNIGKTFAGNFYKLDGLELLKKIKERIDEKVKTAEKQNISEEAKKILDRKE